MGGCRCTFQNCENSTTNSPGLHFFHFPAKQKERCSLWAKYSANKHFLDLPFEKLKNKVVCEAHFKESCFMNYKHERLIKSAVPTLLKLGNNEIIDFENDSPEVCDAKKAQHITFESDDHLSVKINCSESTEPNANINSVVYNITESAVTSENDYLVDLNVMKDDQVIDNYDYSIVSVECPSPPKQAKKNLPILKRVSRVEPKILNASFSSDKRLQFGRPQRIKIDKVQQVKKLSTKTELVKKSPEKDQNSPKRFALIIGDDGSVAKNTQTSLITIAPETPTPDISIQTESVTPAKSADTSIDKDFYIQTMEKQTQQIEELKRLLLESVAAAKENKNQEECKKQSESYSSIRSDKNMSKLQLFNAIKRYLNPSMVALLRMEMFGGLEREWKSDEMEFAIELHNLGSSVYEYMRDEFRFRLPPKKQVEKWIASSDDKDDNIDMLE